MSTAGREALVRELRRLREFTRGDVVRGVASFACPDPACPVTTVKVHFAEEPGVTKPLQPACRCVRCNGELAYVGLQKG
jgi:hypothetical protein